MNLALDDQTFKRIAESFLIGQMIFFKTISTKLSEKVSNGKFKLNGLHRDLPPVQPISKPASVGVGMRN